MSASTTCSAWTVPAGHESAAIVAVAELTGRGLACRRGERLVFSGLDLHVRQSGALIVRGANGSGKTSLLRLLAGLAPPAAGIVLWRGRDVRADREEWGREMRYVGHRDAVKPLLTVAENVAFHARMGGGDASALRVGAALEAFGLAALADTPARFLSAGQRRRVALARLVAAPAPVWLLDEPEAGLDSGAAAALAAVMTEHRAAGGVIVAASHGDPGLAGAETLSLDPRT